MFMLVLHEQCTTPVRHAARRVLLCGDPPHLHSPLPNKKRTWKMDWEMRVGVTNPIVRNLSNVAHKVVPGQQRRASRGHKGRVKRRPAAAAISPEARGGSGFTLEQEGFRLHMEDFCLKVAPSHEQHNHISWFCYLKTQNRGFPMARGPRSSRDSQNGSF